MCADSGGTDMPACDCCGGSISPEDASGGKRVPTLYGPDRKPIRTYRNFSSHPCQNGGSCKCGGTCKGNGYSNWGGIMNRVANIKTRFGANLQACQAEAQAQGMVLGVPTTVAYVQNCLNKKRGNKPVRANIWGWHNPVPNLSGPGSNLYKKLEQCQADAEGLGMVLGQPDTVKWVTDCLRGKHAQVKTDPTLIDDPIPVLPTTTTTTTTTKPTTAGFMGLPNIAWIGLGLLAVYYGNKKGMFKKILK